MKKVIAVIVAYNNPEELRKIISAIISQNYKVFQILCIDNSAKLSIIENNNIIQSFVSNGISIKQIVNEVSNKGSAKGFQLGMKYALKENPDFIWLNDQDGQPENFCLQELINAYTKLNEVAIYAPSIYSSSSNELLEYFRCDVNFYLNSIKHKNKNNSNYEKIKRAGTTGLLIHSEIIINCGEYNGDVFFVGLEDTEYCLRINRRGYKIYCVKNAIYYHPDLNEKYQVSEKIHTKLIRLMHLEFWLPLNMGTFRKNSINQKSKREAGICIGSSYINYLYAPQIIRQINTFYSLGRALIYKLHDRNVVICETYRLYREGRRIAIKNVCKNIQN